MAQSLLNLVLMLQVELQLGSLKLLQPFFELVGSMAEGTRIGIPSELDLGFKFKAWNGCTPFKVEGDPFSLKKSESAPPFMEEFYHEGEFLFHKFMNFLLNAVDKAIGDIFEQKRNPPDLKRVTTNKDWAKGRSACKGKCKKKLKGRKFEQCPACAVTVSQTKSGICLQFEFEWRDKDVVHDIYTSVDLIPIFVIEPIPVMRLARIINEAMLAPGAPEGWLSFLIKYASDYKIVHELANADGVRVCSVGLKTMTFHEGKNHHVKPSQAFTEEKFSSERMKDVYTYVKFLKKALRLDLNSFLVKKELLKEEYQSILDSCGTSSIGQRERYVDRDDLALVQILSQPFFHGKVEDKIDLQESSKWGIVHLKLGE